MVGGSAACVPYAEENGILGRIVAEALVFRRQGLRLGEVIRKGYSRIASIALRATCSPVAARFVRIAHHCRRLRLPPWPSCLRLLASSAKSKPLRSK